MPRIDHYHVFSRLPKFDCFHVINGKPYKNGQVHGKDAADALASFKEICMGGAPTDYVVPVDPS